MLVRKFARVWAVLLVIAMVATGFSSALPNLVGTREMVGNGLLSDNGGPMPQSTAADRDRAPHSVVGMSTLVDATRYGSQRKLVRTDNNTLWAVYEDNNADIWCSNSTDDGVTWSTPLDIGNTAMGCYYPAIATNGTTIYIAWQQQNPNMGNQYDLFFRRSTDGGNTWDPVITGAGRLIWDGGPGLANGNRPTIAANGSNVYVAFEEGGGGGTNRNVGFVSSLNGGTTFGNHVVIYTDPGGRNNYYMSLVVNNNSGLSLAWQRDVGGGLNKIYFSTSANNGTAWSAAVEVGRTTGNELYPSMTGTGSNLYLVWQDDTVGNNEIVFRNSSNQGTSWVPDLAVAPTNVSGDTASSTHPSVSQWKGQVFVIWDTDLDHANRDLYTRLNDSTQWLPVVNYTSDNLGNRYPNLRLDGGAGYFEWVWTGNMTSPYPVYYNRTYSEPNHPLLNWTFEAGYMTDGVDPDSGTTGHVYTYRVNYTSPDNFPPRTGYPQVWIDRNLDNDFGDANEQMTMTEVNSADQNYTDNKFYTYSTRLPTVGTFHYRFIAQDDHNRSASGDPTKLCNGPVINSVNEPPMLDWAETAGYANDGVNPDQGVVGKPFTFLIKYTDVLNESPAANNPKLLLDMDNNGLFNDTVDVVVNMTELTAADTTFSNGKLYTCNYTFIQTGTYGHKFTVADLVNLTNTTPARSGPVVVAAGPPPVLSVTGETGFTADGVSPDQGYFTTDFEFRVKYSSSTGTPPMASGVKIWLDLNRNGTKDANEWFVMTEADLNATDFVAGKVYRYSTKLSVIGSYNYSFEATDDNYGNATLGPYAGPVVLGPNSVPVLSWTGATFFESDGLDPESGNFSTVFYYRVNYTDADNDAPAAGFPKAGTDRNRNTTIDADEWFAMTAVDAADTTFTDGKWYEYNTTFNEQGTYNYSFDAQDSRGAAATGAPLAMKPGPSVIYVPPPDTSPELSWVGNGSYVSSGVAPSLGAPGTAFAWKVRYTDADDDGPAAGYPVVWIDLDQSGAYDAAERFEMVQEDPSDVNLVDGKVYLYTKILANAGSGYRYLFEALEDDGGRAQNLSGTGPLVRANSPPTLDFAGTGNLTNSGVSPSTGLKNSSFTYMVKYNDSDGDMPIGGVTLYVDRDLDGDYSNADEVLATTEVDPTDTNVIDGKEYRAYSTLATAGTYKYRFSALDIGGLAAIGPATVDLTGPVVLSEPPNLPPKLAPAYTQNMGLSRISGEVGTVFSFGVIYSDPENDAAKASWPRVLIDVDGDGSFSGAADLNISMTQGSAMGGGTAFGADVPLKKAGTMHYKFIVQNVRDQWAELGPLDGPIVIKKAETVTTSGGMTDFFWIIIVIIAFIVALVIGYAIGHRKPPEEPLPEPEHMPKHHAHHARHHPHEQAGTGGDDEPNYRDSSPSEPPAGEGSPEGQSAEAPKGDDAPAENKPDEANPDEAKPEEPKPEESKPEEKKTELDDIINNLTVKKEG